MVQASHQLKLGRACIPSQAWEQAITHFQRGLEHEPELSDHSVVSELRSGLSSCEVSRAARDVSTAYAQQLLSQSLRKAFTRKSPSNLHHNLTPRDIAERLLVLADQNRHKAEQLCRDGHGHMQRRQYTAAMCCYEAAVALNVDDEHLAQSFREALDGAQNPKTAQT